MKPTFADADTWEKANLLMQPVFIRTVDNIRKQLETSTWKGSYREFPIWHEDVSPAIQAKVGLLQQELRSAEPQAVAAIEDALADLPQPMPGYELILTKADRTIVVDIWDLCYRICFQNAAAVAEGVAAVVDETLLEEDSVDVDWAKLDAKTKVLVDAVFADCDD
jgi:hypothetical protein